MSFGRKCPVCRKGYIRVFTKMPVMKHLRQRFQNTLYVITRAHLFFFPVRCHDATFHCLSLSEKMYGPNKNTSRSLCRSRKASLNDLEYFDNILHTLAI